MMESEMRPRPRSRRARVPAVGTILLIAACVGPPARRPAAGPVVPRPEFPDPIFEREAWENLNGMWAFDFDPQDAGLGKEWFRPGRHAFSKKIVVPFPWQSELSGLRAVGTQGAGWYRRTFRVAPAWASRRVFLRFGAVDYEARVWVNGREAGAHEGGYTPFEFDVTDLLSRDGDNDLVVRAFDVTDRETPVGKQINWYTPVGGIWQTVWLEARPAVSVAGLACRPDIRTGAVLCDVRVRNATAAAETVDLTISGEGVREVRRPCTVAPGRTASFPIGLVVSSPELWSPEHPRLYPIAVRARSSAGEDVVKSYVALREVKTAKAPGRDYEYVTLNGKPIYLRGALDQSFNPKGIYTFPSDDDIRRDVEIAKECGLNFLRIHIKIDEPRLYYWADRLGMLMMCDLPSPRVDTPAMRRRMEGLFRETLARDANHPSIFSWVLFNETWGLSKHRAAEAQEWLAGFVKLAKSLDPTRLVEDNSPCNSDHVLTDLNTWHFYINDYENAKRHIQEVVDNTHPGSAYNYIGGRVQGTAPLMNSEYGGIDAGMGDQDISWCFKFLTNELRKHPEICGYVYTELMDIEWEHNGFVNYDRTPKEFGYGDLLPGMTLKDLNDADFVVIDAPPCVTAQPGASFEADVLVSRFSESDFHNTCLRWEVSGVTRPKLHLLDRRYLEALKRAGFGRAFRLRQSEQLHLITLDSWESFASGECEVHPAPWDVTKVQRLKVDLPKERALLTLSVGLCNLDDAGAQRHGTLYASNYTQLNVETPPAPRQEVVGEKTLALRFRPVQCADFRWSAVSGNESSGGEKLCGCGTGYFEYHVRLPEQVAPEAIEWLVFAAELSSKALDQKLDWPARRNPHDYPQSDRTKWPSDVTVSLNGVEVATETMPDDPADVCGIQSHLRGHHPGSYGDFWCFVPDIADVGTISKAAARDRMIRIRLEVKRDAKHAGGLAIFGENLGRALSDPVLIVGLRAPVALDAGKANEPVVAASAKFGSAQVPLDWLVLGPFDNAEDKGFDAVYPPEEKIDLVAEVPTVAGLARWKRARAEVDSTGIPSPAGDVCVARLDFRSLFAPNGHAVAYALVRAKAPADTDATLLLGSDGGVKAWVNGALVHGKKVRRKLKPDSDKVAIRLKAGWNRLLLKVAPGSGGWALAARLAAPDGGALQGLEFDASNDPTR